LRVAFNGEGEDYYVINSLIRVSVVGVNGDGKREQFHYY